MTTHTFYVPAQETASADWATVQTVNADGTVDLDVGDSDPVLAVPCQDTVPQVGERVLVQGQGRSRLVLGSSGRMRWRGLYDGGIYQAHDVVRDGDWLMVANKETTDKPAPEPTGDPFWLYEGSSPTTQDTAKQITYGARFTWNTAGYLQGWRAWFVAGNHYTAWLVEDPDGAAVVTQILDAEAQSDGWAEFGLTGNIVGAGTVFDVRVVAREPDPSPTTFSGDWDYDTPPSPAVPASGMVLHANQALDSLRVHKTDNGGGDRSAELGALSVGDIIEALGVRWAIQNITDQGTWIDFTVAPQQQGSPDGVTTFTFETTSATPITYVEDVGYWATSPYAGLVQGYLDGTLNGNAYGVDLLVQAGTGSPDWDVMAVTGGVSGGGGGVQPFVGENSSGYAVTVNSTTLQTTAEFTVTPPAGTTVDKGQVTGGVLLQGSESTGAYQAQVQVAGVQYGVMTRETAPDGHLTLTPSCVYTYQHDGNPYLIRLLVQRFSGTGDATTTTDHRFNKVQVMGWSE